ncbi:MAG: ABC transporter ATP-binding protein [Bifidobacteriaceae bacterium]|jgi:ABC-2 type transport system ATP-binding protein|nr:ABC transporter ATP-binding protein [Bifidobacteriaceae bacterium]
MNNKSLKNGNNKIDAKNAVIKIANVDKWFRLHHNYSLKDAFVNLFTHKKRDKSLFHALSNINFNINSGEAIGLVGINGSGKSTLLKCISGVIKPDKGKVSIKGRIAGLIEVGAGFHPDLTGRENIFLNGAILGMTKEQIIQKFDDIVEFSEIPQFIDSEVRFYSSGMFLRLAFAVAIHSDPDIFLIDEILAVGDAKFREKCLNRISELSKQGKTMVIVSHAEQQIRQLCQRAVWINKGKVQMDGPANEVLDAMNKFTGLKK